MYVFAQFARVLTGCTDESTWLMEMNAVHFIEYWCNSRFHLELNTYLRFVQQIWIKVRSWWQIPTQHQSTRIGGPESASIEIPPSRPHFIKFQKEVFFGQTFFFRNKKSLSKEQLLFSCLCIENQKKKLEGSENSYFWKLT